MPYLHAVTPASIIVMFLMFISTLVRQLTWAEQRYSSSRTFTHLSEGNIFSLAIFAKFDGNTDKQVVSDLV